MMATNSFPDKNYCKHLCFKGVTFNSKLCTYWLLSERFVHSFGPTLFKDFRLAEETLQLLSVSGATSCAKNREITFKQLKYSKICLICHLKGIRKKR